jgi:rhomboid family GlyGly-CTERM serine protease
MKVPYPTEIALFVLLLAICNLPVVNPTAVALFPSAVFDGQVWRWLTYSWAHVSLYHLLLDSTAFLCLYNQLRGNWRTRTFHMICAISFSGLFAILFDPRIETIGLRGLSGVAHGLMVVCALDSIQSNNRPEKIFGWLILLGVSAKCAIEQLTGNVVFAAFHLGNVGFPVPSCHVGGAVGGAISYLIVWLVESLRSHFIIPPMPLKAFARQSGAIM